MGGHCAQKGRLSLALAHGLLHWHTAGGRAWHKVVPLNSPVAASGSGPRAPVLEASACLGLDFLVLPHTKGINVHKMPRVVPGERAALPACTTELHSRAPPACGVLLPVKLCCGHEAGLEART